MAFRDSIARSITRFFVPVIVQDIASDNPTAFGVFVLAYTYASPLDSAGRVAKTLHDLKAHTTHRGVCNDNTGDARNGQCTLCALQFAGWLVVNSVSLYNLRAPPQMLFALCLAHEQSEPRMHMAWDQKCDHWEGLSTEARAPFTARATALETYLKSMTWPLVMQ